LEHVKTAIFILEDSLNQGLQGHVLIGHAVEGKTGYSCWAIREKGSNEIDRTWVDEANKIIGRATTTNP